MSKTSVKDRRAHHRHPMTLDMQGTHDAGGVVARMVARNLSMGGLYCTSATDFPEMTRLAVRLMLPFGSAGEVEPMDLEAVVVRREELPPTNGEPRYEFALYFTNVEDFVRQRLQRFLGLRAGH